MEKAPQAFRTISETAEILDIPQHVLRFWETRFTQIKPMKRGGGRRFYRPEDIDLLKGIRYLLYEQGYTIRGVQKLLKENGIQFVVALGQGDISALEAITQKKIEKQSPDGKSSSRGGFLGLFKSDAKDDADADLFSPRVTGKNKDSRTLLQEALFDLLECKRLLDRSR